MQECVYITRVDVSANCNPVIPTAKISAEQHLGLCPEVHSRFNA